MNPSLTAAALSAALAGVAVAGMTTPAMAGHDMTMPRGYQEYTKAAFDAAKEQRRILFFHATWCPNCRADEADIVRNAASIPADVVIFKADFDKESALKKQYGIPVQDTFVLVDGTGRAVKKWAGSGLRGGGLKAILAAAFPKKM
ncbi:thiol-disulfide isomerase/thioredoxin [Deinococcus metalli]|nr:thioredoxin family protein [Deinococcus metalli]MBB5376279.1 thiol-disulfide isomerase/thioredoxin [Deinococcus metalli]